MYVRKCYRTFISILQSLFTLYPQYVRYVVPYRTETEKLFTCICKYLHKYQYTAIFYDQQIFEEKSL